MTVSDLLQFARDEHAKYRAAVPHMRPDRVAGKLITMSGNADEARLHIVNAFGARLEAERLDPTRADLGWQSDRDARFPHAALVEFYEGVLVPDEFRSHAPTAA